MDEQPPPDVDEREVLEEIAQVLSHDASNRLTTARSSLELARRKGGDEHLERTAVMLDNAAAMIDDVVELARTGRQFDDESWVDLGDLAQEAWMAVDEPEASLRVDDAIRLRADPGGLRLLLENLFQNAVEHGRRNGTVRVGLLREADGEGFYVADDGDGFGQTDTERAFASGISTADGRSGLGLTIVERIADAHDWTIDVNDSRTGGARIEITGVELE